MTSEKEPLKVFLWCHGRTMSTSFLKCMTFVPDTVAWLEPYALIGKFSLKINDPVLSGPFRELVEKHGGAPAVAKIESGYDASDKDFDWLKEQLEGDFPGKKLVFVKDKGGSIFKEVTTHQDKIPLGFRHTFLIRNPRKTMMSHLKFFMKGHVSGAFSNPNLTRGNLRPVQHLNEMWKHVKHQGWESNPVVIDSDELLENPKEILEAYCKEVGIPFAEDLLRWEAGDDVMTKQWMVPKQTILTFRAAGVHDETFASTGFKKPAASGEVNMEQILKQIPPKIMEAVKEMMEREMPYYNEMYAQRLTLKK